MRSSALSSTKVGLLLLSLQYFFLPLTESTLFLSPPLTAVSAGHFEDGYRHGAGTGVIHEIRGGEGRLWFLPFFVFSCSQPLLLFLMPLSRLHGYLSWQLEVWHASWLWSAGSPRRELLRGYCLKQELFA